MTRRELLNTLAQAAEPIYGSREAAAIAHLLVEKLCGLSRMDIALDPQAEVAEPENLRQILADLGAGRPAQYITGEAEFCGRTFGVAEGVLIPRPETEELVGWITAEAGSRQGLRILDIGTGSGIIAVSLAAEIAGSEVFAADISDEALAIAQANAQRNGVQVDFRKVDILSAEAGGQLPSELDIIVSNPPYIPDSDLGSMHLNVTDFEPHIALFVPDNDALIFYRAIARLGQRLLRHGGALYFEIYEKYGHAMHLMLAEEGYIDIEVRRDINDKDRMVRCIKG